MSVVLLFFSSKVYCLILLALLAAALVLSGCIDTGAGFDNGSGSDSADFGSNIDSVSDGTDTSDNIDSVSDGTDTPDSSPGSVSDSTDAPGVDTDSVSNGTNPLDGSTGPAGISEDVPYDSAAGYLTGQETKEIVAEPIRRGRLPEVYDPNPAYDRYALVEYAVDDIGAEFTATVSAEDDGSEYEVHCTLGKTEQIVILDEDYNVIYDRTGSMGDDAPLIVQAAVEEDNWRAIGD